MKKAASAAFFFGKLWKISHCEERCDEAIRKPLIVPPRDYFATLAMT